MTSLETALKAVAALDSKKAIDIKLLKVKDLTMIADYFIVASGTSTTHVKALADEVEYKLSEANIKHGNIEGYVTAAWIAMDYNEVIIHIFNEETRSFYSLERLWADAENIDISSLCN